MSGKEQHKAILETRILHTAHIADKNLATAPQSREMLLTEYGAELERLLTDWKKQGFESDPRIKWAEEVLQELKTGCTDVQQLTETGTDSDIMFLIRTRRSVRRWSEKEVSDQSVKKLLEAARWAPSSGNRQAVRLVVLRSEACKEVVVQLKEEFLRRAPVIILVGVDLRVYKPTEMRTLAYLDAAAAIENMLLAGHTEGLGCVWSKLDQEDWQFRPNLYFEMKKKLCLPNSFLPLSLIGMGWPAKPTRTPPRHKTEDFVRFDNEGFPPDNCREWRPNYFRLFVRKTKVKLLKRMKRALSNIFFSASR